MGRYHVGSVVTTRRFKGELNYRVVSVRGGGWYHIQCVERCINGMWYKINNALAYIITIKGGRLIPTNLETEG